MESNKIKLVIAGLGAAATIFTGIMPSSIPTTCRSLPSQIPDPTVWKWRAGNGIFPKNAAFPLPKSCLPCRRWRTRQ